MSDEVKAPQFSPTVTKKLDESKLEFLTFPQAMEKVIAGAKLTKFEWGDESIYIFLDNRLRIHKKGEDSPLILSSGDMQGDDWYVI